MKFFRLLYIFVLTSSLLFITIVSYVGYKETKKVAGVSTENTVKKVQGIILPHHELARELIIRSLEKISRDQNYTNIVIIGPNHFYPYETSFVTSAEFSGVAADTEVIRNLAAGTNMSNDAKVLKAEHSFNIPAKYLANFFPEAKYVPVIVPQNYDRGRLIKIAEYLADKLPENTLFVASTDFSHENTVLEAERRNNESVEAIKNFDYEKIYKFNSQNMDSPGSIGLLLNIMEKKGSKDFELLFSSHGAFIEDNPELQGTSYVIGTFSR